MKTYQQYKRLAIKELTGKYPEEIEEERERLIREKNKNPDKIYLSTEHLYTYSSFDLNLIINSLIMIDLGKELKK